MKSHLLSIAALTVAMTAPAASGQQTAPGRALVSTIGSAEIRVMPDVADLYFQVEVRSPDLSKARNDQAERASKVLVALRRAGVAEAELQTSQVEINPHYDVRANEPSAANSRSFQETARVGFYTVSQDISCTLHDVRKVPNVTTDAVAAGATGLQSASLRTSELRKYRDQARAKAIRAAKEKAVALASELGTKVGRPYAITEGAVYDSTHSRFNRSNFQTSSDGGTTSGSENAAPTFAPGTISVNASVKVSFILE
jgi:uncharacterized protein